MTARREHGAPSARVVLEVAEALRWSDPALGASLAEHVRRLAGDDTAVRAAADRSVLRSLAESGRYTEVVERAIPLLDEAYERGDRDDGAEVLVELATAAVGLGDTAVAGRLLDGLGPVGEFPARIAASAWATRAEVCAEAGDVTGADDAGKAASPVLFRVPQPDAEVLRARLGVARGVARARSGDTDGAVVALDAAISVDPAADVDHGRRSLLAAAELVELLVAQGRVDEARRRAQSMLPGDLTDPVLAEPAGRLRLVSAGAEGGGGSGIARSVAEAAESAGRLGDAARAWQSVAAVAEERGALEEALDALRHGHELATRARNAGDRALRSLDVVAARPDALAAPSPDLELLHDPELLHDAAPATRRRRGHRRDGADGALLAPSAEASERTGPEALAEDATTAVDSDAHEPVRSAADAGATVDDGSPSLPLLPSVTDPEPGRSARDELAELLASLTRSVDSSLNGTPVAGDSQTLPAPTPDDTPAPVQVDQDQEPTLESQPTVGESPRRSRHSATAGTAASSEGSASRPTFDAFSTAPSRGADQAAVADGAVPQDRFVPVPGPEPAALPASPPVFEPERSTPTLLDDIETGQGRESLGRESRGSGLLEWGPAETGSRDAGLDGDRSGLQPRSVTELLEEHRASGAELRERDDRGALARESRGDTRVEENGAAGHGPRTADEFAPGDSPAPVPERRPRPGPVLAPQGTGRPAVPDRSAVSDDVPPTNQKPTDLNPREERTTDRATPVSRDGGAPPLSGASTERRSDEGAGDARGARRDRPTPRPQRVEEPAGSEEATSGRRGAGERRGVLPSRRLADEYADELALTRTSVLAEYDLPDVAAAASHGGPTDERAPRSSATGLAVPSARLHASGSMAVPGERWEPRCGTSPSPSPRGGVDEPERPSTAGARTRPPESGARLADLLAEAMDAFRHVGPSVPDAPRPPGVGSRRA